MSTVKDFSFGLGVAWRERRAWKTKTSSLGKYITAADATLFAIDMVMGSLVQILLRADHYSAEIVTESRLALAAFENTGDWTLPVIRDIREHTSKVEDAPSHFDMAPKSKAISLPTPRRNEQRSSSLEKCGQRRCRT